MENSNMENATDTFDISRLQTLAEAGDTDAQYKLGLCYKYNLGACYGDGVGQDLDMAMSFYTAVAGHGNEDALAVLNRLNRRLVMQNCFTGPRNGDRDGGVYI